MLSSSSSNFYLQTCCMIMRIQLDCNACCRKARKILLNMKEIETHMIDKQQRRISVCGRFRPSDVAIKLRKKMNRRVEILEIQEFGDSSYVSHHEHDEPPRSMIPGSTHYAQRLETFQSQRLSLKGIMQRHTQGPIANTATAW